MFPANDYSNTHALLLDQGHQLCNGLGCKGGLHGKSGASNIDFWGRVKQTGWVHGGKALLSLKWPLGVRSSESSSFLECKRHFQHNVLPQPQLHPSRAWWETLSRNHPGKSLQIPHHRHSRTVCSLAVTWMDVVTPHLMTHTCFPPIPSSPWPHEERWLSSL